MRELLLSASTWILKFHLLFSVTALLTLALFALLKSDYGSQRKVGHLALIAAFLFLAAGPLLPQTNVFEPPVQVAAQSSGTFERSPKMSVSLAPLTSLPPSKQTSFILALATLLFAVTVATFTKRARLIIKDRRRLRDLIRESHLIRKIGRVEIRVTESLSVPLAARTRASAVVLIPQDLLGLADQTKMILQHELQHHRQGDLGWGALLTEAVWAIGGWNPLLRRWLRALEERDELACDEALLGRQGFDDQAYATCLFDVAKSVIARTTITGEEARLVGTARMAVSPQFLKRRIEMIVQERKTKVGWASRFVVIASVPVILATVASLAVAGESLISDRRVSRVTATELARKAQTRTGIPVTVNRRVLDWVNRATATPRARFFMRNTLKRMKTYEPMVAAKLLAAQLPTGLVALPAMESGYQNTETATSAGLWQFIPQTARNYGLQVDDAKDERLDAEKETGAAVAYLSHLQQLFGGDLNLSLLSYNAGEEFVQKLVRETGSRDVFRFADEGRLTNESANYVPKFMAALIILENPDLVKE